MTDSPGDLPRYLQLMWGIDGARRGPKPKLSIDDIGRAAVAVADTEGFDAVSMKAIADRLGVTTMSLYRYVDSKEDVYEIMIDEAYGAPATSLAAAGSWRTRLTDWARAIADALRAHPWVTRIPMTHPPSGPRTLQWTEAGLRAFDDTALTSQEKLSSMLVIDGFIRNHVRMSTELGAISDAGRAEADRYGIIVGQVIDEVGYPRLTRAVREEVLADDTDFYTDELAFGLGLILDGIAERVEAGRPPTG